VNVRNSLVLAERLVTSFAGGLELLFEMSGFQHRIRRQSLDAGVDALDIGKSSEVLRPSAF
jgi:hypothetical protein